jgi:hypothetical protein
MLAEVLDRVPLMPFDPLPRIPPAVLPARRYQLGPLAVVPFMLYLALAAIAHAQPGNWTSFTQGTTTRYVGTDAQDGQWIGWSYRLGTTDYCNAFNAADPDGHKHCWSWRLATTTHTTCD